MVQGVQAFVITAETSPAKGFSEKPPENFYDILHKAKDSQSCRTEKKPEQNMTERKALDSSKTDMKKKLSERDEPSACEKAEKKPEQPQTEDEAEIMAVQAALTAAESEAILQEPVDDPAVVSKSVVNAEAHGAVLTALGGSGFPVEQEAAQAGGASSVNGNGAVTPLPGTTQIPLVQNADFHENAVLTGGGAANVQFLGEKNAVPGMPLSEGGKRLPDERNVSDLAGTASSDMDMKAELLSASSRNETASEQGGYLMEHQKAMKQAGGNVYVREAVNAHKEPRHGQPVDVDALQAKVNDSDYMDGRLMISRNLWGNVGVWNAADGGNEKTDAASILGQLQNGMGENIKKGMTQFTIRLKPEGLGELVVRMTDVGGRMTMSIGASQLETQRILNSELADLRHQMQSLNIQVDEIYHSESGGLDMMSFQQNGGPWQQGSAYHSGGGKHLEGTYNLTEEDILTDTALGGNTVVLQDGRLNTYI